MESLIAYRARILANNVSGLMHYIPSGFRDMLSCSLSDFWKVYSVAHSLSVEDYKKQRISAIEQLLEKERES